MRHLCDSTPERRACLSEGHRSNFFSCLRLYLLRIHFIFISPLRLIETGSKYSPGPRNFETPKLKSVDPWFIHSHRYDFPMIAICYPPIRRCVATFDTVVLFCKNRSSTRRIDAVGNIAVIEVRSAL